MEKACGSVRIVRLDLMRVAYYRAKSATPENDAWAVMKAWIEGQGLLEKPGTRIFGFNNPNPGQGTPVYGYEIWVSIPEDLAVGDPVQSKHFPGGLYAVLPTTLYEISAKWDELGTWAMDSEEYDIDLDGLFTTHPGLEEHLFDGGIDITRDFPLILYCPVKKARGKTI